MFEDRIQNLARVVQQFRGTVGFKGAFYQRGAKWVYVTSQGKTQRYPKAGVGVYPIT